MKHKNKLEDNRNKTQGLSKNLCEEIKPQKMRTLPTEVTNFSDLPDEAHIRLNVMKILFGCSSSTIYRSIKSGLLPAPHHFLGMKNSCWQVGKVRAALAKHD
jgi:predicted DNA-binding transcriptional regulator AlpA